ncbi:MAG: YdcF family protein [Clostridia bacterium]|nr:YdcF family protein [Clostridia bacterium]
MKIFVLLGNRMKDDGSLSDLMKLRLELAVKYYFENKPDYVIVSGGIANPVAGVAEADKMEEYLLASGVPTEVIIKEDKSLTTKQNAEFSCPKAKELGADTLVLCTSKEHMNRWYLNPVRLFKRYLKKYGAADIKLETYTND